MISSAYIREWRQSAPWTQDAQVEQDLILSRALVEIFSHLHLAKNLAFRGGTALYKLHLSQARYSEDIDLWKAFDVTDERPDRVIECFLTYMEHEGRRVSRAEFEENLLLKLEDHRFLEDIGPLLAPDCPCDMESAADCVLNRLAVLIPGAPWEGRGKRCAGSHPLRGVSDRGM